ncbi:UvrD-helicase domain-containing protein [Roseomonas sp. BN140053]|uniref:UvrD-helicase domain-containing protein n=1 Tax=Roseomonas sp. BN140053 TaxID=3391898 RepID=UPI0039ED30AE
MTPDALLGSRHSLVVAPAGCGKTHLLSETVRANTAGRILVLTHTRAGVAVIRSRLRTVPAHAYRVSTFDSWAGWLAKQFPGVSGYIPTGTARDYALAKECALRLLRIGAVQRALAATYCRVLVDEYQGFGRQQFAMVDAIMSVLPAVAFGDPMQAIFGFNEALPGWAETTKGFETEWELSEPHRWTRVGEETLGRWVLQCRSDLAKGLSIDLSKGPPNVCWLPLSSLDEIGCQLRAIAAAPIDGTLLAINDSRFTQQRRALAQRGGAGLSVVETAELPDLRAAAVQIGASAGLVRVGHLLDFASSVMIGVDKRGLLDRVMGVCAGNITPASEEDWALFHAQNLEGVATALTALRRTRDVFRPDLLEALLEAARNHGDDLVAAAAKVRARRLDIGRRVEPRAIGSTLLLKGLEADHVVVLDADGMSRRDLYVAISRGSKTLTVVSRSPVLPIR